MPGYKRRYLDDMTSEDRAALRNAVWDGAFWILAVNDPDLVQRLAAEQLIREREGRWVLTLSGHRHRRLTERSW